MRNGKDRHYLAFPHEDHRIPVLIRLFPHVSNVAHRAEVTSTWSTKLHCRAKSGNVLFLRRTCLRGG